MAGLRINLLCIPIKFICRIAAETENVPTYDVRTHLSYFLHIYYMFYFIGSSQSDITYLTWQIFPIENSAPYVNLPIKNKIILYLEMLFANITQGF